MPTKKYALPPKGHEWWQQFAVALGSQMPELGEVPAKRLAVLLADSAPPPPDIPPDPPA